MGHGARKPDPEVIKLFSCSTQLSMKFQLLIKTKTPTNKEVSCFKSLRCCIYHADKCLNANNWHCWHFNIISRINLVLSCVEHEKSFITSGPYFHVCDEFKLKPACLATDIEILLVDNGLIIISRKQVTKALIRLHGCAGWSVP